MTAQAGPYWLAPLMAWIALMVLLVATVGYAHLPGAPMKPEASLTIAAIKAGLLGTVFMRLNRASPLVRAAALTGLLWASLLFLLGASDYLSRLA